MRPYCTAREEEDEQGNVHVDESKDEEEVEEEEEDVYEIMGEVNERGIEYILFSRVTQKNFFYFILQLFLDKSCQMV